MSEPQSNDLCAFQRKTCRDTDIPEGEDHEDRADTEDRGHAKSGRIRDKSNPAISKEYQ